MANRAPAFQFYPKDWLDFKVQRMSYEAQGVYLKMLCFMWNDSIDQCSISTTVQPLSTALGLSITKCNTILKEIQDKNEPIFEEKDGRFISSRLKAERKKQDKYRSAQSKKGKRSAELRRNRGSTVVQPDTQPEGKSSSSSSTSLKKKVERKKSENKELLRLQEKFNIYLAVSDEYLQEQITEFPRAKSKTVLGDLYAFESGNKAGTKNACSRLRNFFKKANERNGQGVPGDLSNIASGFPGVN